MNRSTVTALLAAKAALGATLATGFLLSPSAPARVAYADPGTVVNANGVAVATVNLSDLPYIDALPVCGVEDCSDIPVTAQPGLWFDPDSHDSYVMWTDGPTFLVVDDTAVFTGGLC